MCVCTGPTKKNLILFLDELQTAGSSEDFFADDLTEQLDKALCIVKCDTEPVAKVMEAIEHIENSEEDDLPFITLLLKRHVRCKEILDTARAVCDRRKLELKGDEKIKEVLEKNGGLSGAKVLDMAGQQRVPLERLRPDGRGVTRRRSMDEVRRSRAELEPIADGA